MSRQHFPALTGLRFFLAFWVVLHHLTGPGMMLDAWSQSMWPPLTRLIQSGYLAVGIFFELSGFVLARAYESPNWSGRTLLKYAVGRFARVYPVYALSLAVMLPFIFESTVKGKAEVLASHGLVLQGWTTTLPVSWNAPAWSLTCEIFFYLCFPVCAVVLRRVNWKAGLAIALVTCFLPGLLRLSGVPQAWKPILHLADFVMGILAARAMDLAAGARLRNRGYWLYVPSALAAIALTAFPIAVGSFWNVNTALRPLYAIVLVGLSLGGGLAAAGLSSGLSVYLGKASYSMYILHVPLLWWFQRLGYASPGPMAVLYMGVVVGLSTLVFRYVEEPSNRYLRERFGARGVN
jgi:peptidoglycan/LPS O-acetylase OafA/YrhL